MKRYAVGDIIARTGFESVKREITEVRKTGYEWKYPDMGKVTNAGDPNSFMSENGTDPFLQHGWTLIYTEQE
jgi:hypothetical protein